MIQSRYAKITRELLIHVEAKFYREFEDRFRGDESSILRRLKQYSEFYMPIANVYKGLNIFDAGCGRGEWLQIMNALNFSCVGVDSNPNMVSYVDEKVIIGDALSELDLISNNTQAIVSAFHLVEHLDCDLIYKFIKQSHEVLLPGGILIVETPNCENLETSSTSFWLDPTHIRPIPIQLLQFFTSQCGFYRTKVVRFQESNELHNKHSILNLSDVLFGASPDIAIVAQKGPPSHILIQQLNPAFEKKYGFSLRDLVERYDKQIETKKLYSRNRRKRKVILSD